MTRWREAAIAVGEGSLPPSAGDPLDVLEQAMRYYYGLGVQAIAKQSAGRDGAEML